ncbi:ScyD/ScyE family protein [Agromyces cerinus]|uniref:ScyD/ScyE family protein n=1 Tax=Agromyces cerinus subsp. cerinus TaxID=232089 RepID=A0A1N6FK95_9MICO|nr:ScyD/ScyE family protein [Agromyces cerinus]SIN95646.1 hypothetical protein SAMN05443544_2108 [Agromyces cerinus subsp. cerinus]
MHTRIPLIGVAMAAAVTLAIATPAIAAQPSGTPSTRAEGLVSPLGLAIDASGRAYVSQNFIGVLSLVDKKGQSTPLVATQGDEVSAPAVDGSTVYYVTTNGDHTSAWLKSMSNGVETQVADLAAYESTENPDAVNTYGFSDLSAECEAEFVPFPPFPPLGMPNYAGIVDTHAYGATAVGGDVYIADAGANAVLKVDAEGVISTVAVLPPAAPVTITAENIGEAPWPACVFGHGYRAEPVPTDVEMGPDGLLYVTSLPGGSEDPALGPRGVVYSIDPGTGETNLVATGFGGATGIAVAPNGTLYVAELFGGPMGAGQVAVVAPGASAATSVIEVSMPSAVSVRAETLYVTTDSLGDAKLTVVPLKGGAHAKK